MKSKCFLRLHRLASRPLERRNRSLELVFSVLTLPLVQCAAVVDALVIYNFVDRSQVLMVMSAGWKHELILSS